MAVDNKRRFLPNQPLIEAGGTAARWFRDFLVKVDEAINVAGISAGWGNIIGTLSDQTDLQTALNGKANTGHTHVEADITDLQAYLLDAPSDGEQYGRKDGAWDIITVPPLAPEVKSELAEPGGDPLYPNTTAILHFEGPNGSTTFTDDSALGEDWSASDVQIDTSQSRSGTSSGYFDGTATSRVYKGNGINEFVPTDEWVFELSLRMQALPSGAPVTTTDYAPLSTKPAGTNSGMRLNINNSGNITIEAWNNSGSAFDNSAGATLSLASGAWYDIRLEHDPVAKTITQYVNGTENGVLTYTGTLTRGATDISIGQQQQPGDYRTFYGWIDEGRITKGNQRDEADYTVVLPFPNVQSTAYTIVDADLNKVIRFTGNNADVTLPTGLNASPGDRLWLRQAGTGTLVLTTTGVTINGSLPSWSQHTEVQLRNVATDEFDVAA